MTSHQAASKLQEILAKKKNLFLPEMDIKQDHICQMWSGIILFPYEKKGNEHLEIK